MNNGFFKNGDAGITLHIVQQSPRGQGARGRPAQQTPPSNEFGEKLHKAFVNSAMTQAEFAEILAIELQTPVSQVSVSNWLRGAEPRRRPDRPTFTEEILKVAEAVAETEQSAGRKKFAAAAEVTKQFAAWDKLEVTPRQLQVAGEISASLYKAWRSGASIPNTRWILFRDKVNMWLDFIAENQKSWKKLESAGPVKTPAPQRKARKVSAKK